MDFFAVYLYELGPVLWALVTPHGQLYKTDKSALLEAPEKNIPVSAQPPAGSSWVIDVFANIQELVAPSTVPNELRSTWYSKTFDYVTELVLVMLHHLQVE